MNLLRRVVSAGMFLGCLSAVAAAGFEDAFVDGASHWAAFQAEGDWSCADGLFSTRGGEEYAGRLADLAPQSDVLMEMEARCGDSQRRNFGLTLRVQDDRTRVVVRYYDRLDALEIIAFEQNAPLTIERTEQAIGLQPDEWYRFKAAAIGDMVLAKCWRATDSEPGWQVRMPYADARPGRVGLIAHDGTHADFRAVRVAWGDELAALRAELDAERAAWRARLNERLVLELEPVPFVLRENGMRRVLARTMLDKEPIPVNGVFHVSAGGHESTHAVTAAESTPDGWPLYVPEPGEPVELDVRFDTETGQHLTAHCSLAPARPWTFYMTPHTHYDIGYTEPQPKVIERLTREMNDAIRFCEETADWSEESRYRWTVEVTSLADLFRKRYPDRMDAFLRLVREGRIEICGYYLNMPTELTGHEETIRCLYHAEDFRQRYGVTIDTVMIDDVPGYAWVLADLLVEAGMPRASFRANSIRGQFLWYRDGAVPRPFYWEGPAGKRLFVWYTDSYREGNFFREPGLHEAQFLGLVRRNEATGTGVTDIQLRMGGDNLPPDLDASTNARAWNETYLLPRVVIATNREFLDVLEATYGSAAPAVSGDIPSWWADGPASTALETGLARLTHDRLIAVEALWTLATLYVPGTRYPHERIRQAYDFMIHFDEHTWGASESISDPHGEGTRAQWEWKAGQATQAAALTGALESEALALLAACVPAAPGNCVAVWNTMGIAGRGIVALPRAGGFAVSEDVRRAVDIRTDRVAPAQWDAETQTLYFLADGVPAFGCAVYRLENGAQEAVSGAAGEVFLENERYRLAFSPDTGLWTSFYDKRNHRELLDPDAAWAGNQAVREMPQGGREAIDRKQPVAFDRVPSGPCRFVACQTGPVYQSLTFETSLPGCPRIVQTYRLFDDWLDVEDVFEKEEVLDPESIAIAFPFRVETPEFRVEIADAVMRPGIDQLPFSCYDFYSIQHWAVAGSGEYSVLWTPLDAPLASFSDLSMYRWADRLRFDRGHIYSLVMTNCWTTNFRAGQEGTLRFRYRLAAAGPDLSASEAAALAWRPFYPLLPFLPGGKEGAPEAVRPLLSLEGAPAVISCLKRAESRDAILVRMVDFDGVAGPRVLRVSLPDGLRLRESYATTPVETRLGALPLEDGAVTVDMPAHGIATVELAEDRM